MRDNLVHKKCGYPFLYLDPISNDPNMNPELVWRPFVLSAVGILMMVTSFGLGLSRVMSETP